ncbi:ankyrin repeat-containing protein [Apiospora saccharicola]|uniref:Ankyrin repeat-containing protein n=1 Tax=Apiospora saccharicola TaxID=335842 RepID=A0ABR1UJ08_9PEZI
MESPKPGAAGPLQHSDYTVGWVCALPKEQTAATAMLDERHRDRELHLKKQPNDTNTYTLGAIGGHNIVIACLPKGKFGTISAATVAAHMVSTFPAIRFGLMVGIGGAVSRKVRLGDVVVSTPSGTHPGVVQWDMGKAGDHFERTGSLNNPPNMLLTALTKLETDHDTEGSKVPDYLQAVGEKNSRLRAKYEKSQLVDQLFEASYDHAREPHEVEEDEMEDDAGNDDCRNCDPAQTVKRKSRDMMVHYGTIASGNQVIKNAKLRDQLSIDLGGNILCVEMEAAGLMDNFPCIVIRGICDYADSHKNDAWQEHAAAVAAAFTKEFLSYIQASEVEGERTVQETLHAVCDGISFIKDDTAHTRTMLKDQADLDVLNWLTPTNYGPQHSDYLRRRQPGTGHKRLSRFVPFVRRLAECLGQIDPLSNQGLARSSRDNPFIPRRPLLTMRDGRWLSKPGQTLFCHGMPGAGKTILSSIIINDLENRLHDNNSATVVYVYLNFKRKDEHSVEGVLLSLLKQLAQIRPSLPKAVFVVIDALDEYQTETGSRGHFLSMLSGLQATTHMNLLTTAREVPDIWDHFKNERSPHIEVRASDEDIRMYLGSHVSQLGNLIIQRGGLEELIVEQIAKSVQGMFLLAQLHLESLKEKDTVNAVRKTLDRMSALSSSAESTYHHAYEDTMTRITGQLANHAQRAKQVLGWITHAMRPMSKHELQHALGVKLGGTKLDPDDLPDISHLASVCAGLVTIDEESGIIRLVHYTAQEYFVLTKKQWFPEFHEIITRTCISYLSFEPFTSGPCPSVVQLGERFEHHPFYSYASSQWGYHARESQLGDALLPLLQKEKEIDAAEQAREYIVEYSPNFQERPASCPLKRTGLHSAAAFGLENAVRGLLLVYSVNARNTWEDTALELAAKGNHTEVVRLLIEKGADEYSQRMALSEASFRDHLEVIRCLTDYESVKSSPGLMDFCFHFAAVRHCWETCELLAQRGADINTGNAGRQTALHLAVMSRDMKGVELLINQGANVNVTDYSGRTPLFLAVKKKRVEVNMIQFLLEHGADVNIGSRLGYTPLDQADVNLKRWSWKLWGGARIPQCIEVIELLVKCGGRRLMAIDKSTGRGLRPIKRK